MRKSYTILVIFFSLHFSIVFSQERLDSLFCVSELDSLEKLFGQDKNILENYKVSILKTLSYFPELKHTKIRFKKAKLKTSLTTRPTFISLFFRRKKNRTYIVRVDDRKDKIRVKDASFNAQIGVFGHEFAHIVDYSQRSIFGIIGRGLAYLSKKKKEEFEKSIDRMTISHGLRIQMFEWAKFVLNSPKGSEKYKIFKREIYLEPNEILKEKI